MQDQTRQPSNDHDAKPHPYKLPGTTRGIIRRHRNKFVILLVALAIVVFVLISSPF